MNATVKYIAELDHVKEIALVGAADLAFWKDRLRPAGLHPTEFGGDALVMISAIESRFLGVAFREATISVSLSAQGGGSGRDGAYLVRAYNSSRLLAFVERACFSSPYVHSDLRIDARDAASVEIRRGDETDLSLSMSATPGRAPLRRGREDWRGPVFLPSRRTDAAGPSRFFPARVCGESSAYAFSPSEDAVTIRPRRGDTGLLSLVESRFAGRKWVLREDGSHAKGRTVSGGPAAAAFAFG